MMVVGAYGDSHLRPVTLCPASVTHRPAALADFFPPKRSSRPMRMILLTAIGGLLVSLNTGCCGLRGFLCPWEGYWSGCGYGCGSTCDACYGGCGTTGACGGCASCGNCGGGCGGSCGDSGCGAGGCDTCGGCDSCGSCGAGCCATGTCGQCASCLARFNERGNFGTEGGGSVAYPYYTVRGPRDFLASNPRSIGR